MLKNNKRKKKARQDKPENEANNMELKQRGEGSEAKANKEWLPQHLPSSPLLSHPLQHSPSSTNPQHQKRLFLSPILAFFLLTVLLSLQDGRLLPFPNHPNSNRQSSKWSLVNLIPKLSKWSKSRRPNCLSARRFLLWLW